ncbi:MAG: hypothetical protein AAFS10_24435, partial [Myxococcota bacterium]
MRFLAEQLEIGTQERIKVEQPCDLVMVYRQAIRVTGVLLLVPIGLMILVLVYAATGVAGVLVMSAFSLVHVLLLLMLLGVLGTLERPLVRLMCWCWWPVHRWWLLHHNPGRLKFVVERRKIERSCPVTIDLDPDHGVLTIGSRTLDVSEVCSIQLERSEDPEPRLRVLVGTAHQRPLVVCAVVPELLPEQCRESWLGLPHLEGDSVLLDWVSFCHFVQVLRTTSEASRKSWPSLLDWVCDGARA